MLRHLPPVGNAVTLRAGKGWGTPAFPPWRSHWYGSGTAALAAALVAAKVAMPRGSSQPWQVILPAYGCPDLVAASRYAGLEVILCDLAPGLPYLDLQRLSQLLSARTAAVVAVDLCGIPERHAELRRVIAGGAGSRALLIEDAAQAYPPGPGVAPAWQGDLVVLSFGRGKPVSLLSGGALFCPPDSAVAKRLPPPSGRPLPLWRSWLAATGYNLLRRPWLYWLPARLPLGLGATRYHPLPALEAPGRAINRWLPANLARVPVASAMLRRWREHLGKAGMLERGVIDLADACGCPPDSSLLRYPLLLPMQPARESIAEAARLGVSRLYGESLSDLGDVRPHLGSQTGESVESARDFAARLITLPLHDQVRDRDMRATVAWLERVLDQLDHP